MNGSANGEVAFLLGAGRSGTTLLYKLLSLHPDVGYISNYENRLPWFPAGWMLRFVNARISLKSGAWFRQGNAYFTRRPIAKKLIPTPVEGEAVYAACGIPLWMRGELALPQASIDGLRRRFEKIRADSNAKILLSKRTANNRRLRILNEIFPTARYIHLIRDGRDVARSLSKVEWWADHTLFWDGRRASELEQAGEDRIVLCARNWVHELAALEADLEQIDRRRIYELRYEDLLANPIDQLTPLLAFLGVQITSEYSDTVKSLNLSYRPIDWRSEWSEDELARVLKEEQVTLRRLGYIG